MRKRQRQEEQFHRSPWEREKEWTRKHNNKHTVLSMYSVHRINPQCVLTNITQLPPDCVCGRSPFGPFSPPPVPPPIPAHRHWNRRVFFRAGTHSHAVKSKWIADSGESVQPGFDPSSEAGAGRETGVVSFTIKLEVFGYCWYHRRAGHVGRHGHTCT